MLTPKQLRELRATVGNPNRLTKAAELAELTHAQIAAGVGSSQPHITEIANGRYSRLPLETARGIAKLFGASIEDIFPDVNSDAQAHESGAYAR